MKLKNKAINSKILVAILKDGDHKVVEPVDIKKVPKADKMAHMLKLLHKMNLMISVID